MKSSDAEAESSCSARPGVVSSNRKRSHKLRFLPICPLDQAFPGKRGGSDRSNPAATMKDRFRKRRSTLMAFLSRATWRKKHYPRDPTWHSRGESFSDLDLQGSRRSNALESPPMDSSIGAITKAVVHLKKSSADPMTLSAEKCTPILISDYEVHDLVAVCLEDRFFSELNQCNAEALPDLRLKRAHVAPILCYESSESDDENEVEVASMLMKTTELPTSLAKSRLMKLEKFPEKYRGLSELRGFDAALRSRLEALTLQEERLGWEHPDVQFLASHIRLEHRRRQRSLTACSESGH